MKRVLLAIGAFALMCSPAYALSPDFTAHYCISRGYELETIGGNRLCVFEDDQFCDAVDFSNEECGDDYRDGLSCADDLEPYQNECVERFQECIDPPNQFEACHDKIENGYRIERYKLECPDNYLKKELQYDGFGITTAEADCVAVNFTVFPDVPANAPEFDAVDWMARNGVVEGYSDGNFHPEWPVNRVEFLKMLYEALYPNFGSASDTSPDLSAPLAPVTSNKFWDLPDDPQWYTPYLTEAFVAGVVSGYPDQSFRPNDPINVAEAAKIVGNAYLDVDRIFDDTYELGLAVCSLDRSAYVTQWFYPYIAVLDQSCIFPESITENTGYHPDVELTRGEMAILIYRAKAVRDNSQSYDDFKAECDPDEDKGGCQFRYEYFSQFEPPEDL